MLYFSGDSIQALLEPHHCSNGFEPPEVSKPHHTRLQGECITNYAIAASSPVLLASGMEASDFISITRCLVYTPCQEAKYTLWHAVASLELFLFVWFSLGFIYLAKIECPTTNLSHSAVAHIGELPLYACGQDKI